ncbi:hypothetical protein GE061_009335 [Apolygus lucorum]|uniref:Uncharacterized protein n=1 Tax=Apolygus lucorum TaxID=248454 RepID=A0A8S9XZW1_APOLU|nr:hypothetical protein GE061_009335 [Apolygus lucorum]
MEDVTGMLAEWGLSAATIEIFRESNEINQSSLSPATATNKRTNTNAPQTPGCIKARSFIAFFETPEQKGAHHQGLILANSGFVQPYIAVLGNVYNI